MSNYFIRLHILITFLFTGIILSSCKEPVPPEYTGIENIVVDEINSETAKLTGEVILMSEEKVSWNIRDVDIDVFQDEKNVGNLKIADNSKIEFGKNTVPVILIINLKEVGKLNSLLSLLVSKSITVNLRGNIKVGKFVYNKVLPVNETIEFQLEK
ncbi:hypothetical protein OO013_18320 [Mangrovivirga sp. M17]|uniref:Late embryogenesis abundant protein LEA-2 subgroup domain-containing protein n=1 Tax=Mangrovivirga halotolerans TaxID=2993936 RepID=A0ABT3RVQ3_9BACT|nr:hypothetical protein [Mangrovivirga halotolerans]MCX2745844.1 hypothetical protein [Mangrovivirga halotolerans]